MQFDWRTTLDNWTKFLQNEGQIVIAVNTSEDNTFEDVKAYTDYLSQTSGVEYTVFKTEIPYSDPLFDGKIKNEALKKCTRGFCTLLDIDELLPMSTRQAWEEAMIGLKGSSYDALLIPVVDLFNDENSYKSIGFKWFLHKNLPYINRGRVNFAIKADGKTDITKSDTTEIVDKDGNLIPAIPTIPTNLTDEQKLNYLRLNMTPYVIHVGYLDKEQRIRQSEFWAPHWNNRAGQEVEKPITKEKLDKIPYFPHYLKSYNEE